MSLNTALSGLAAASADLKVTGNNIANASTVGFKSSRAEFADIYASSLQGIGTSLIGNGVRLSKIAQQFDQGNISFTDNRMDLAVDGSGFFILSDNGAISYTRAGAFGLDNEGFIVGTGSARVQGFTANAAGELTGLTGDIQLKIPNLQPKQTTLVEVGVNLDARQPVLSKEGTRTVTRGAAVGVPSLGIPVSTPTVMNTAGAPVPFDYSVNTRASLQASNAIVPFDFSSSVSTFQVRLAGSSIPSENRTVTVTLDSDIANIQGLISEIRDDLLGTGIGVDVRENPASPGRIEFFATNAGDPSSITIDPLDNATFGVGVLQSDVEAVLGGIQLGAGGNAGSSNLVPNPNGGSSVVGVQGVRSSATFEVILSGSSGNNGTATVVLDTNITTTTQLIADIRDDLLASGINLDVREDPNNAGRLQFFSTVSGEDSTIAIGSIDATNNGVAETNVTQTLNLATGISVPGVAAASNVYQAQTVDVKYPDGNTIPVSIEENSSAAEIAAKFNSAGVPGVTATANTTATLLSSGFDNGSGTMRLSINGVQVPGSSLVQIAETINSGLQGLNSLSAALDENGNLLIEDRIGKDLVFAVEGQGSDQIEIEGLQGLPLVVDSSGAGVGVVGGSITLSLEEGITLANAQPSVTNIFGVLTPSIYEPFQINTFNPSDQGTYNAATSMKIFDSLGNPHTLSMYFVKEQFTPDVAGEEANRWTMYALIDGRDIGDPNPELPPPQNLEPTRAKANVRFDENGQLSFLTPAMLVSNWTPLDEDGKPLGAVGPQNLLSGGVLPIPVPPISSNFEIRLTNSTQFGAEFAVNDLQQDGYSTGRVDGIEIASDGIVSARFSNGLTQTLGQVALANFNNVQGLRAVGDTSWLETSDSGSPTIGAPGSGALGSINSGALEDSNVDLSKQLVNLIVAQRNFQANARTITTVNELTQTIINI